MLDITAHHSVAAWNFIYTISGLLVVAYLVPFLRREVAGSGTFKSLVTEHRLRMILGFLLVALAFAIRIGPWIPWRSMLLAGNEGLADWWKLQAGLWTGPGAVAMCAGMTLVMWDALKSVFGRGAFAFALMFPFGLYGAGIVVAEFLARLF